MIVGAGIMGLATALSLRRRRHEVVVLEQGPVPNDRGGSVDHHRLIRYPYGQQPGYARMVVGAYAAWERLWADLGQRLYVPTGQILAGPPDDPWIAGSIASLQELGLAHEIVRGGAIAERFPLLAAERLTQVLTSPTGGVLLAQRIVAALAGHLERQGGRIERGTRVVELAQPAAITEGGERFAGDMLVVTAGPWAPRLVPALARSVVPSRQVLVYLAPPPDLAAAWQRAPMITDLLTSEVSVFYAVPPVAGTPLKIGDHRFSNEGDPDEARVARPDDVEAVLALARTRLTRFHDYEVLGARTCFYDVAPHERFVAVREGSMLALGGFSGHGFKFGAVIGERTAEVLERPELFESFAAWLGGETEAGPLAG